VIRIGTLKALRDSVEGQEPTGQQQQTKDKANKFKQRNISDAVEAMNEG
jgi:hypothetical protein